MPKKGRAFVGARGAKPQKGGTKDASKLSAKREREEAGTSRWATLGTKRIRYSEPVTIDLSDEMEEREAKRAKWRAKKAAYRARKKERRNIAAQEAAETDRQEQAELVAIVLNDTEDPVKHKTALRRHQRAASKITAVLQHVATTQSTDDVLKTLEILTTNPQLADWFKEAGFGPSTTLDTLIVDNIRAAIQGLSGRKDDDSRRALKVLLRAMQDPKGKTPEKRGAAARNSRRSQVGLSAEAPTAEAPAAAPAATPAAAPAAPPALAAASPSTPAGAPAASAAPTPGSNIPPAKLAERLGVVVSTFCKNAKEVRREQRERLSNPQVLACWVDMRRRIGPLKAKADVARLVHEFLMDNTHIRTSPSPKDTLLVRGPDGKRNVRVPRMLVEVSRTQLFRDFLEEHPDIKIRERTFRGLFPKNFRRLTKRFESCGCTKCIETKGAHQSLTVGRGNLKKIHGDAYQPYDHKTPADAVADLLCQPAVCQETGTTMPTPPAPCWMGRCDKCGIKKNYKPPAQELDESDRAFKIKATTFAYVDAPTVHKPERKLLQKTTSTYSIGEFTRDVYLPLLQDYAYHLNLLRALDLCRRQREARLPVGDAADLRDFAEKLSSEFEDAPQHEHWQNVTVTIETAVIEAYDKELLKNLREGDGSAARAAEAAARAAFAAADNAMAQLTARRRDHHHFFISDVKAQDATVVHRNMDELIQKLIDQGTLKEGTSTLWQTTDGCGAQYWCSRAVWLLSKLSKKYKITIDRMRSCPGHGKSKADGAHAVLKVFMRNVMAKKDTKDDSKVGARRARAAPTSALTILSSPPLRAGVLHRAGRRGGRREGVPCAGGGARARPFAAAQGGRGARARSHHEQQTRGRGPRGVQRVPPLPRGRRP